MGSQNTKLAELRLPEKAKKLFADNGLTALWPPQQLAVDAGVLEGESLVVSAPTAGGKTLIAELAIANRLLSGGGKALYLVPLRALASQKYDDFKKWRQAGIGVAVSVGDLDSSDGRLSSYDLIIMTYEKCDSILRHAAQIPWIRDVSVVVADEVHLLGDSSRGPALEVVLTRLRLINPEVQLIALSATVGNAEAVARWLGCKLVRSDWRPVKLNQGVFYDGAIYFEDGRVEDLGSHGEPVVQLVRDAVDQGGQVLVFTSTRKQASAVASKLAGYVPLTETERSALKSASQKIARADDAGPLSKQLAEVLKEGAAFHHAGLPHSARSVVEDAFKTRLLKALVSTTTLAAGMNLPARRVVVYDYARYEFGWGRQRIPVMEYHQMAGRAGRPGLDPYGEAIMIAKRRDEVEDLTANFIRAPPETLEPHLTDEQAVLPHVLSSIASEYCTTREALNGFFASTFSGTVMSDFAMRRSVERALSYLITHGFVYDYTTQLQATPLGKMTSDLYLHPVSSLLMVEAGGFRPDLESEQPLMHLVALPFEVMKPRLSQEERDEYTAELDELEETLPVSLEAYEELVSEFQVDAFESYVQAWKASKVLTAWVREVQEGEIEKDFGVQPGDLYQLYSTATWVARSMETMFATAMHNRTLYTSFSKLARRLESGVREELLPLVQLPGIGRVRARALFNMGVRTLADVAEAPIDKITSLRGVSTSLARQIKEEAQRRLN